MIVAAAGVQGAAVPSVSRCINFGDKSLISSLQFVPTATVTRTETFTATRVFHTLVPTSPYLMDMTTLTAWTETETDTLYATRYPNA